MRGRSSTCIAQHTDSIASVGDATPAHGAVAPTTKLQQCSITSVASPLDKVSVFVLEPDAGTSFYHPPTHPPDETRWLTAVAIIKYVGGSSYAVHKSLWIL